MMINTTIPASMWGTYLRGLIPGIWSVPSADMEGYIHKVLQVKSSRTLELECLITFEVPDPTSILTVLSTTQPVSTTNVTSHTKSSPSTSPDLSNPQPTTSSTIPDT
ncbi:hypothetical protein HKD37_04G010928 [Glycine soja]